MNRLAWAILLVVAATTPFAGQAPADGAIIGRISDISGAAMPGSRVSVSGGDERRETVTAIDGRFAFPLLRLGAYNVTVELSGFVQRSGTITLTPEVPRAHIAWHLEVGCLETVTVFRSPREVARWADAIVHVRVTSDDGRVLWSLKPDCAGRIVQSYTVDVLHTVVRRTGSDDRQAALPIFQLPGMVPLKPGAEYAILLGATSLVASAPVLPVVSGRIAAGAEGLPTGMAVEDALESLGRWAREGQR